MKFMGKAVSSRSQAEQVQSNLIRRFRMFSKVKLSGRAVLLVIGLSLLAAGQLNADPSNLWKDSGADIFYDQGRVGIGTATPQAPLHVKNSVGGSDVLVEVTGGFDADFTLKSDGGTWCWSTTKEGNFGVFRDCGDVPALSILAGAAGSTDRVSIGTTEPLNRALLHVESDFEGAGSTINVRNRNPNGDASIAFFNATGDVVGDIAWRPKLAGGTMIINESHKSNTVMNLPGNGNVGIGTEIPLSKLAVQGLPPSPPDASGTAGLLCITNDGNIWIDKTPATPCS